MTPAIEAALVAAPLSLGGALIMRWFEIRARSAAWRREDQLRFIQDKRQAYADFLGGCQWVITNSTQIRSADWQHLQSSLQTVFLLAPAKLVRPAQQLLNRTLTVTDPDTKTDQEFAEWAQEFSDLCDEARLDLGMDVTKVS